MGKNRSHGTPEQFEQAVRQRIDELSGGVESATAITADTEESGLFADPNGIIGEAGELYTYQELKQMYEDGVQTDPWLASYPTFKSWYNQIILGYLTRVSSEADLEDDDDDLGPWEFLGSKQVMDSDGFWTDYTLWVNHETGMYVCIFGDNDLYTPENSSPDFETESEFEAYEWFEDYDTGELEGEDDIYDEIHGATSSGKGPIVAKDNGMENPGYVSLILDIIPDFLKDSGIADEVTKVDQDGSDIVFTFKQDGNTYTAHFPEYELTGRDHDDLPDDEWLIEDAARDAIAGISAATNTCGIAAKPVVGSDVLYVDDGGMLGEPGAQYKYDELYDMFVCNWDDDPVMEDYDSFDAWFKDTKPYLRIVNASSKIDADLSEVPDVTEVVIEGSEDDEVDQRSMTTRDLLKWLRDKGIDTTKHRYELQAESYERYGGGRVYTYQFSAPGDWVAYLSMRLHRNMKPANVIEFVNEYLIEFDYLDDLGSVDAIREEAESSWWGDGDDFIHYLKNLDTGEMLYEAGDYDEPESEEELDWED